MYISHETWGGFASFLLSSLYPVICASGLHPKLHTASVCSHVQCAALTERGVGVSTQRWLAWLPTTHSCCSRLHRDVIDQLEFSGGLAFKSRLSGHRLNATSVDASEPNAALGNPIHIDESVRSTSERGSLQNKTRWKTIHRLIFLFNVTEK